MINLAIVDDSVIHSQRVKQLLNTIDSLRVTSFVSKEDFLLFEGNKDFEVMILDIELGEESGVDFSKELWKSHPDLMIIFLSSYEHYMKEAFGLNVFQYMLKENMETDLVPALRELLVLVEERKPRVVSFRTHEGELEFKERDIYYVLYEDRHPVLYHRSGSFSVLGLSLSDVANRLSEDLFVKANSGCLVNLKHIYKLNNKEFRLKQASFIIPIARGRYSEVHKKYVAMLIKGDAL